MRINDRRGFTFPEVAVTAAILGILAVSVTAIFMVSSRTYQVGAADQAAERAASLGLRRMVPDVHLAMLVEADTGPSAGSHLILTLPVRDWDDATHEYRLRLATDATGHLGLVPGDVVHYYRGDSAGALSPTGDCLWRMVVQPDGSPGKKYRVAAGIVDNPVDPATGSPRPMFVYWPNEVLRESVEITVTARAREGSRVATRTAHSEVALRNL